MVSEVAVSDSSKVLDLCTGTGDLAILLAGKIGRQGEVFAVDFCPEMLEIAYQKVKRHQLESRVKFIEADATSLPFETSTFDAVTIAYGIRNITRRKDALAEMLRVLKPGGRVVCLEFSKLTWPGARTVYSFYLSRLVPLVGKIFVQGDAYSYLSSSVKAFPNQQKLKELMGAVGFRSTQYFNLSGGISAIHTGLK